MKNSGVKWVGCIPDRWETVYLSAVLSERKHKNSGMKEQNLLSLSYGQVKAKDINTNDGLLPESFEGYNIIEKDDIVLRLTDLQNDQHSLRTGLCKERGIITSAYCTLKPNLALSDARYLQYYLYCFDICKGFYGMGAGVRQGLNYDGIRKIELLLPSKSEQSSIADYIEKKVSGIDALIANQEKQIEKLKQYKQALITEVVTKGLDPTVPMKDSGVEWIGSIPKHWTIVRFKQIASVKSNLVNPLEYLSYPQVSHENIEKGSGKLFPCQTVGEVGVESNNHLFRVGQILYSKVRPILNKATIAPFDGLCSADMYPIETILNVQYLLYLMLSNVFLYQVKLVTENRVKMPKINQEEISQIKLCCAPDKEQYAIVSYLNLRCSQIDILTSKLEQKIEKLNQYKQSLIYEYVTGKKEVLA